MTDAAALIAAVCDRPDDDTPRLVYADWLDDHGAADRAEFIRLQVRLARDFGGPSRGCKWPHTLTMDVTTADTDGREVVDTGPTLTCADPGLERHPWCEACRERAELERRERELFRQSPETHAWFGPALALTVMGSEWVDYLSWFSRGFVEHVTCPAADWLAHGDEIVAAHPVRAVALTTRATQSELVAYLLSGRAKSFYRDADDGMWSFFWPKITFTLPPPARTHQYSPWERAAARTARRVAILSSPDTGARIDRG